MTVPVKMAVALALAMILARLAYAAGFFRTVFYLPDIMPPVAIGILILVLFNGSTGIINRGLGLIGIPGPFWTTDPDWIKPSLAIMSIWTIGGTMVIYLAALKAVPRGLYEAAAMDGAGPWRRFFNVTLPMISPALFFTFIVLTIAGLQTFTEVYTAYFGARQHGRGVAGRRADERRLHLPAGVRVLRDRLRVCAGVDPVRDHHGDHGACSSSSAGVSSSTRARSDERPTRSAMSSGGPDNFPTGGAGTLTPRVG